MRAWQTGLVRTRSSGPPPAEALRISRSTPVEIPVQLDRGAEAPLPVQLAAALREAIDDGSLRPGDSLLATREFAGRLGVARGVVVVAYEQLVAEGYLAAERGRGTAVNPDLADTRNLSALRGTGDPPRRAEADPDAIDRTRPPLAPGAPLTDATERPEWRAAWRAAVGGADRPAPPLGDPRLRREIAEHLRLVRGASRSASEVIVTAGARDGLGLLLASLGVSRAGGIVVGVEDPGYPSLRAAAQRLGARIVSLPVDADGLRTDRLPEGRLDLVIVTPSHQYPVGGSLPLPRRRELLDWAARTGVVLVEDDYDSELRHVGSPLPALAALDDPVRGSVVTLGTFSSTITPALAAGFLLAPENLRRLIEPVRRDLGSPVSAVAQRSLAGYLASGALRRNIARMRRRYAARRDLISESFAGVPGVRARPMSGGLHAVIELSGCGARQREAAIVQRARGLGVAALGAYWQHESADRTAGLVLGMGGPDEAEFRAALEALRRILIGA